MMNMMATAAAAGHNSTGSMFESTSNVARPGSALSAASIENIVNPLGTVTQIVRSPGGGGGCGGDPMADSFQSQDIVFPDQYIHENCDEGMFRPIVTIVEQKLGKDEVMEQPQKPPTRMNTNLIVPVIVPTIPKAQPQPVQKTVEEKKQQQQQKVAEEEEKPQKEVITQKEEKLREAEKVVMEQEEVVVVEEPVVVEVKKQTTAPATKQQQQKNNKKNKEKTPPPPPPITQQQPPQNVMITSMNTGSASASPAPVAEENNKPATKTNGSKGRKSSGQEPKAGKIRKSDKNIEIMNVEEENGKEVELPPPPTKVEEVKEEPEAEDKKPKQPETEIEEKPAAADFDHLPEVEVTMPSKQEMEIIQDSLMKETIVEAVTVVVTSGANGGAGGKKKKNRQKTPPKAVVVEPEPEPEPEEPVMVEVEKQEMIVDISETNYDLSACIEEGDDVEFEAMYADPLVPLEPFDPMVTFEAVVCPEDDSLHAEDNYVDESLMTFESPSGEGEKERQVLEEKDDEKLEKLHKVFTDRNLVFAMCTSWREGSGEESNQMIGGATEENVNVSSAPGWQLEIHEDYMDMDRSEKKLMMESMHKLSPVLTASTGSSEEEVSSSSNSDGKTTTSSGHTTTTATEEDDEEEEVVKGGRGKGRSVPNDYDEELQPLIKSKESLEQFEAGCGEEGKEDVEGQRPGEPSAVAAENKSKESTPQPQGKGGAGQSGKKKSRKKKR